MQKGGTVGILLVVIGILAAVVWGGYSIFGDEEPMPVAQQLAQDSATQEDTRATRSYVILDNSFAYSGGYVYYKSGESSAGEPTYSIVPQADPATFQKIGSASPPQPASRPASGGSGAAGGGSGSVTTGSGSSGQSTASQSISQGSTQSELGSIGGSGGGSTYSVTYYSDENNVYVTVETDGQTSEPQVIVGADPDTFEILNAEYAKDNEHVYVIIVTCIGGTCSASVSVVESADPDTFQAYPNSQNVLNSNCSGYVVADGQDAYHVYNNGQVVDGISVYLIGTGGTCDDTPVLISP